MSKNFDVSIEKQDQILRGERIKYIREHELRLNKTDLAKQIGISSQFLGLVEEGKGHLVYRRVKLLRNLNGEENRRQISEKRLERMLQVWVRENTFMVLKEAADYVTLSNDEEGVAKFIEKYVLD